MKKKIFYGILTIAILTVFTYNVTIVKKAHYAEVSLNSLLRGSMAEGESTCCIGDKFKIEPIPGGWRCVNNAGNSCCPIC